LGLCVAFLLPRKQSLPLNSKLSTLNMTHDQRVAR
jgi:hypothetical protein